MSHGQIDSEVIAQLLSLLHEHLSERYRHIDEHLLEESIEDAVLRYGAHPEQFDASRGDFLSYLLSWVRSYLYRGRRKETRHRLHEKAAGVSDKIFERIVSEAGVGRSIYNIGRDESEKEVEEREERRERQRAILNAMMARLDSCELAEVQLFLAGASHEEWVRHMGIEHLPPEEQREEVNKEKARLKINLKRWAQKMQGGRNQFGARVRISSLDADGEREAWPTQLKMSYIQPADGCGAGQHSSASCSLLSVCCCW
ncbi:MAG TPA: sigma factor [Gemmataceae bacterium]|nr:sigma factor [Gemmataceae bacterium]